MERAVHTPIEEMGFFKEYVAVADWAWSVVSKWPFLAQDTVGKQLVRAIDRVGATLVEGDGRYSDLEASHFFLIARGDHANLRTAPFVNRIKTIAHNVENRAVQSNGQRLPSRGKRRNRGIAKLITR